MNAVPREVEESAAPAAKQDIGDALRRGTRMKDRAIGREIPVKATSEESGRSERSCLRELLSPPDVYLYLN